MMKMMKAFAAILVAMAVSSSASAQLWSESFEVDGLGTNYTVSNTFLNTANDFFTRTNGSNISNTSGAYNGQDGSFFWAGEDLDDATAPNLGDLLAYKVITFSPINITGATNLEFRGLFATGNTGNGWDYLDSLYVQYNVDGAGWVKFMQFASLTTGTNTGLYHDTNLDGLGEGTQLNPTFQQFTALLPVSGNSLQIRLRCSSNSGAEEFAFDLLSVYDLAVSVPGCTDPSAANYNPAATTDDGSCEYEGCTDPLALNYDPIATIDDGSCILSLPEIIINEVHYNPCTAQGDDLLYEFIEFYNASGSAVDLTGWTVSNAINHTFNGVTIAAGEYIVLAKNATSYTGFGYQAIQWDLGDLNNTSETIVLNHPAGLVVDQFTYGDIAPFPTQPDGGCPSLELIATNLDNSIPTNWQASYVANGTPGAANSAPPVATPVTIVELQDGTVATGTYISTSGIVTCIFPAANLYTIQDGNGPNTGIWVSGTGVAVGDEVNVDGIVTESFSLTLITSPIITIVSSGNPLPADELLSTFGVNDEVWEGVLVRTTAQCDNDNLGFGEWSLNDGSGIAIIDDLGLPYLPVVFETYTVRGPLYFSFGAYKITPCAPADIMKWGCTDPLAINYDAEASIDDGTCTAAPILGCTNPIAVNFDPSATQDDGSCIIPGCTDNLALNFDPVATLDDGSCYYTLPTLVINEIHYNPCATQGTDTEFEFIELYNGGVDLIDLSGFTFGAGVIYTFPEGSSIAPGEYIIVTVNAASYTGQGYQVFEWTTDNLGNSGEPIVLEDGFNNVVDSVDYGITAPWPAGANGSCASLELIDEILDNVLAENWQASYVSNGTPGAENSTPIIPGCTDPAAVNYNATATVDDGSCDYLGCTYAEATNFNPIATIDDHSCVFNFVDPCPADFNNDGLVGVSDLLFFIGTYGTNCP